MKTISEFLLVAAAAFAVSACSNKNVEPECPVVPESGLLPNQFAAGTAATKMAIDSEWKLSWETSDAVAIWDGTDTTVFHPTSGGSSKTVLEAEGFEADGSKTYYAVYPASAVTGFSGTSVTIEIDRDRTASAGAFPSAPAVGSTTGDVRSFDFANVCGLVSFNITEDDIAYVVLFGGGDEDIAGTVTVNAATGAVASVVDGEKSILLTPASGSAFAAGRYYVAVLPQAFASGMSISLYKTDGSRVRRNINAFTLAASQHVDLDDVDAGRTWKTSYTIKNADELQAFLAVADQLGSEAEVSLANDIDLTGVTLTPATSFAGTFDGASHSLTNWAATTALFSTVSGTVKNLTIASTCSMTIPTNDDCAFIALENSGTIEGCVNYAPMATVSGAVFDSDEPVSIGAFAAVSSGTITGCTNNAAVSLSPESVTIAGSSTQLHSARYLGGVVGKVVGTGGSAKVTDCTNTGTVSYTTAACIGGKSYVGGVVGGTPATLSTALNTWADCGDNAVIEGCTNSGDVLYKYDVQEISCVNEPNTGGVAGYIEGSVENCSNSGSVTVSTPKFDGADATNQNYYLRCSKTGGVAGTVSGAMTGCSNSGNVSLTGNISNGGYGEYVGSVANPCIAGVVGEGPLSEGITDCHNTGKITVDNTKCYNSSPIFQIAGVVGYTASLVKDCDNSGEIVAVTQGKEVSVGGVAARTYNAVNNCHNLAGGTITVTQNVHDSSLSGLSQPDILKVGGVLGFTNVANMVVVDDASNAAAINVTSYADQTVNGTKPAESNFVGLFVGGVLGLSNNASSYSVRCRNLAGGDVTVTAGDKITRACVGGVAGQTHGGFKDFVNSAALVKFTGGAYTTDGVYCRVGGLVAHTTGQANMIESYTRNANEADIEVESAGRLMVGGAIGYSVRDCSNVFNEGDVTVVAKSNLECVGGLIGQFSRNNLNDCGTSGNVSLTRDAGLTSVSGVSGLGLAVGYSNAEASFKNCTVSGTLTRIVKDSSNVPFGIAAGKLNNALTLGAAGAPFTIKDGSILNGTAITASNYSNDDVLVGNLNSKVLTKTNVTFE